MLGRISVLAFVTSIALGAAPLQAESACKGLEKGTCETKSECSWVDPYTRKDSVKVSGHCRTKSGKKSSKDGTKSSKDSKKSSKDSQESSKDSKKPSEDGKK